MRAKILHLITTRLRINPNLSGNWFTHTESSGKLVRVRFPGLVARILSLTKFQGFSEHDSEKLQAEASDFHGEDIFVLDNFASAAQNW